MNFHTNTIEELKKLNHNKNVLELLLSDLHIYPTDKIDSLVEENEIIVTNFLPDEINKPIKIDTHKSLCEKLFFCPLKDHISTDLSP